MDYLAFFGLETEPFSNAPVGRFYYDSAQSSQALVRLRFALSAMKGLALCIGDVGAGKTTLARRLLSSLSEDEYEASLLVILHKDITSDWLLRRIAFQLGIDTPHADKLVLLAQLYQRLIEIYESGRKAVMLIDEAQMLESRDLMEEFRGLLNLEVPDRKLLSFVFFGLPTMENHLRLDAPLLQRVAVRVELSPFDLESTKDYIEHRIQVAGGEKNIFNKEVIRAIYDVSGGVPRVINTICDNTLLECALVQKKNISVKQVLVAAKNLGLSPQVSPVVTSSSLLTPVQDHSPLDEIDRILKDLEKFN